MKLREEIIKTIKAKMLYIVWNEEFYQEFADLLLTLFRTYCRENLKQDPYNNGVIYGNLKELLSGLETEETNGK